MNADIISILRSPAGARLAFDGSGFTDPAGRRYSFENGVAMLYDDADVSPFLKHDRDYFRISNEQASQAKTQEWDLAEANYRRARGINSDFMFSILRYEDPQGKRVAEIGVGAGDLIRRFARTGFRAIAVDFFPWDMQTARDAGVRAAEPELSCVAAPMCRLPFADASIDLVYFHAALHHALPREAASFRWSDPVNLLDCLCEVRRVLKPRAQGGAFFLLGEGIYPEAFSREDRHYERIVEADPEANVYESWYKISEYEDAYRRSAIFPNLFLWQEDFRVRAIGYDQDGDRIDLVTQDDLISDENYWQLGEKLAAQASRLLPPWMSVDASLNPYGDLFPANEAVLSGLHTMIGCKAVAGGVPVHTVSAGSVGFLLFGPYVTLEPGRYEVRFIFRIDTASLGGELVFDCHGAGGPVGATRPVALSGVPAGTWQTVLLPLDVPARLTQFEARAFLASPADASVEMVSAVSIRDTADATPRRAQSIIAPMLPAIAPARAEPDVAPTSRAIMTLQEFDEVFADVAALPTELERINVLCNVHLADPAIISMPDDPFSSEYEAAVMRVYTKLSGRDVYDAAICEKVPINVEETVRKPSIYMHDGTFLGNYLEGMGQIIKLMDVHAGTRVLEYGAGDGQTSLHLARLGCDVTVIDIEEAYLQIVRGQAEQLGVPITTILGDFHTGADLPRFDRIFYFQAFHHSLAHQRVMQTLHDLLNKDGFVVFAAEPVIDPTGYWRSAVPYPWGPRLDGLSLRAMRNFGWMELGFQEAYFMAALARFGWKAEKCDSATNGLGTCIIARH